MLFNFLDVAEASVQVNETSCNCNPLRSLVEDTFTYRQVRHILKLLQLDQEPDPDIETHRFDAKIRSDHRPSQNSAKIHSRSEQEEEQQRAVGSFARRRFSHQQLDRLRQTGSRRRLFRRCSRLHFKTQLLLAKQSRSLLVHSSRSWSRTNLPIVDRTANLEMVFATSGSFFALALGSHVQKSRFEKASGHDVFRQHSP